MERAESLAEMLKVTRATPLRGESFDAFFVNTDEARGENTASRLSDYFEVNAEDPQKVLFMGHRGSGKSTELYRVERLLGERFRVVNFSMIDEVDTSDLKYIDVIFTVLSMIYEAAREDGVRIDENVLRQLDDYWNNETFREDIRLSRGEISGESRVKGGLWGVFSVHIKGIFKTGTESKEVVRKYIEPRLGRLLQTTNDLIADVSDKYRQQNKTLLVIIEDLDKLDIEVAETLFLRHRNILAGLNVHIVYTFPIFLLYSEKFNTISEAFSHTELLSMIKVTDMKGEPFPAGRQTLQKLIEQRVDPALFDAEALDLIISRSGGAIRHVLDMIQYAALEERGRNREANRISRESARKGYLKIRSYFERCIEGRHIPILRDLYASRDKKPLPDETLKEMLSCLAVIEYNGDRWCGLHPAVVDYLTGKGEIAG